MTSREKRRREFVKAQADRRAAIERELNKGVDKPNCGCIAKWQWVWSGADWIMPERFSLITGACKQHCADQLYKDFHALLNERMATVRNENGVPQ